MSLPKSIACMFVALLALAALGGCGRGAVGVVISPANPAPMGPGESTNFTALSGGSKGVMWSLSGDGALANATQTTVTYTAPATVAASFSVTITATSVDHPSLSASVTIVVNTAFSITTTTLPGGTVGTAYSATVAQSGASGTVTWSAPSGGLPAGLTLASATGVISGTPTTAGTSTFTIQATDTAGRMATQSLTIAVIAPPVVTTTTLASGMVGTSYQVSLTYSGGGTGTPVWAVVSGTLTGSGITLSSGGVLSGAPTTAGTYTFSVTVTSGGLTSAAQALSLTIAPLPPPVVTTTTLPNATVGVTYSQQLGYSGGGTGSATWALASGSLTGTGITLSASGLLSGTPTSAGTLNFSVTVTVGGTSSAAQALTLTVVPPPLVVTTTSLPNGTINTAYSQQLAYSGGPSGTPVWNIASGSLTGSGITLSTSGLLSGTPTTSGSYTFGVTVTVGASTSSAQSLQLTVLGVSPIITSTTALTGEVNLPFSATLTATGGTPPYTWTETGTLPAGLSLASNGVLSGTPTSNSASPYSITVKATDSASGVGTQVDVLTINAARSSSSATAQLHGQYAFLLHGLDASGNPLAEAGTFTTDGAGNVSNGVLDINGTGLSAASLNNSLTASTYSIGADNRGKITLTTSAGSSTFVLALNSITAGVAGGGSMTEFDNKGQVLAGTFSLQDGSAFSTGSLTGGFAFGLSGNTLTLNQRTGVVGELQLNGAGGTTSGELTSSTNGPAAVAVTSTAYNVATNGRGTLALTLAGGGGAWNFVTYTVSAKRLLLLSSDAASGSSAKSLLAGEALAQTIANGSFVASSLNGTAVYRSEALGSRTGSSGTTYFPDVQIGLAKFVSGNITLAGDENAGGTASSASAVGTYTVASNGRAVVDLVLGAAPGTIGGCATCTVSEQYGYLVGANQGFLMGEAAGVSTGYFEAQTATGISTATLSGTYSLGGIQPLVSAAGGITGVVSVNGAGTFTATQDQSLSGQLFPDAALSGTDSVASTGRGTIAVSGGNPAPVVYVISTSKALWLDTNASNPVIGVLVK